MTSIGRSAFYACENLETLYIPASVAQFGSEEYDLGEDQVFSPGITLIVESGSAAQAYAEVSGQPYRINGA